MGRPIGAARQVLYSGHVRALPYLIPTFLASLNQTIVMPVLQAGLSVYAVFKVGSVDVVNPNKSLASLAAGPS